MTYCTWTWEDMCYISVQHTNKQLCCGKEPITQVHFTYATLPVLCRTPLPPQVAVSFTSLHLAGSLPISLCLSPSHPFLNYLFIYLFILIIYSFSVILCYFFYLYFFKRLESISWVGRLIGTKPLYSHYQFWLGTDGWGMYIRLQRETT